MPGEQSRVNGRKGGRPKGSKSDPAAAQVRQFIIDHAMELVRAKYEAAVGSSHVFVKTGDGWKHVTDPKAVEAALNGPEEFVRVFDVPVDQTAIEQLLNRGLGKPTESLEIAPREPVEVHHHFVFDG